MTVVRTDKTFNGRPTHYYILDGHRADSVTSLLSGGVPKPALINWAANVTAAYAVDHWDELAELAISVRLKTLQNARTEELDQAARRGTEVHKLGERLVRHEDIEVPPELEGHVESYLGFLNTWHPVARFVEAIVANRKIGYCGTFDLMAYLPDLDETWLFDIKTGRSGIFPETALQMAAYRWAEVLVLESGAPEHMMPVVDRTAAIHVRSDGFDVVPVETGQEVFTAFRHAAWLARCIKEDMPGWVGEALEVPAA